jgi:hypothetical protein
MWNGSIGLRIESSADRCEHGNELLVSIKSIKGGEFFDWLSEYHLLKKDSVACG